MWLITGFKGRRNLIMRKEEFKILVKAMKAVYADPKFIPDQYAYDVWFAMLEDGKRYQSL